MVEIVQKYLISQGITNVYIGHEPAESDNCVTILNDGGNINPKFAIDEINIKVRVKASEYLTALTISENVTNVLNGCKPIIDDVGKINGIVAKRIANYIGHDELDSHYFINEFVCFYSPKNIGNRLKI